MHTKQLFSLISPLPKKERDTIRTLLQTLGKGKNNNTFMLFEMICKMKRWKDTSEKDLKAPFHSDHDAYYIARTNLGERLLKGLGNMQRSPIEMLPFYQYAVDMSLVGYILKLFVKDLRALLDKEDYTKAVCLMELIEDAIARSPNKIDTKARKAYDKLPSAYTIRGWDNEIAEMRHGIRRVRSALQQPMAERLVLAEELWEEYAEVDVYSSKARLDQNRLKARICMLRRDLGNAAIHGLPVLETLFEAKPSLEISNMMLDEYQYLISALLELEKVDTASQLVMKMNTIVIRTPQQQEKKYFLECKNLVAMAIHTQDLEWAVKAEARLLKNSTHYPRKHDSWWYFIASVHFSNQNFSKCNLLLNRHIKQRPKNRLKIHWMSEFLMNLSFFMREETDYALKNFKKLSKKIPDKSTSITTELCNMICSIITKAPSLRSQEIDFWRAKFEPAFSNPSNADILHYFDVFAFLEALQNRVPMASIDTRRFSNPQKTNGPSENQFFG